MLVCIFFLYYSYVMCVLCSDIIYGNIILLFLLDYYVTYTDFRSIYSQRRCLPVYKYVAVPEPRRVYEVIAEAEVLRQILVWRIRCHYAQVVFVLLTKLKFYLHETFLLFVATFISLTLSSKVIFSTYVVRVVSRQLGREGHLKPEPKARV